MRGWQNWDSPYVYDNSNRTVPVEFPNHSFSVESVLKKIAIIVKLKELVIDLRV